MSSVLPLLMTTKAVDISDLYGWGLNTVSQIGDDLGMTYLTPSVDDSSWIDIAASYVGGSVAVPHISFGIKTDGTLWTWGGQALGSGISSASTYILYSPVQIGTATNWSKCFQSYNGGFAIKTDGSLWFWGANVTGTSGTIGAPTIVSSPIQIGALTNWATICVSGGTTAQTVKAIKTDGTLWAWGAAANGALGNGTTTPTISSPIQIGALTNWAKLSSSGGSNSTTVMAVKTDGTLWAWGVASNGVLGNGTTTPNISSPIQIGALSNWSQTSSGNGWVAAVKTDGTLWSWGLNTSGQLGDGTTASKSSPIQIGASTDWARVEATFSQTGVALKTDGSLWTWGASPFFELADGTLVSRSSPVQVGSFGGVTTFKLTSGTASGPVFMLADNALYGWGGTSQLGIGTNGMSPTFVNSAVSQASFGASHASFIKSNHTLWANGWNTSGQIGQNNTSTALYRVPTQVGSLSDWAQVSSGNDFTMAVKTDGTLWGWGSGADGRLGNGLSTNTSSPVQIGTLTTWAQVSCGFSFAAAVKTDGTLWAWGLGTSGQLGDGTVGSKTAPVQIGLLTNWAQVSAGTSFCTAVKTNGTLWSWGLGTSGQLGDGTIVSKSSPVQIGALSNWSQTSAGNGFAMAVKTNGTLYSWGINTSGQLGDGTTSLRNSPVQIGALTTWAQVLAIGDNGGSALKTDGSIWSWGSNLSSSLGAGDQTILSVSSPVQIAASGYTALATNATAGTAGAIT